MGVGDVLLNKCTNLDSMDLPMSYEQFKIPEQRFRLDESILLGVQYQATSDILIFIPIPIPIPIPSWNSTISVPNKSQGVRTPDALTVRFAEKVSSIER